MKERLYRAFYDNGHDYGEFEFYSSHRAGSKANFEDAKNTMMKNYSYYDVKSMKVLNTMLIKAM